MTDSFSRPANSQRRPWLKPISEQKLSAQLPTILAATLRQRGFISVQMITDWPLIVGKNLAADSRPQQIIRDKASGTARLVIQIRPGLALELQHLAPLVIEKINQYFGYQFITRLSLVQNLNPIDRVKKPSPSRHSISGRVKEQSVTPIDLSHPIRDPELRLALLNLAQNLAQSEAR
ncbi:MAG: DUF721 domain-containing protein [Candidatus Pacebacteria bacterium]|nr:DUF721 domain-containing protein [Candidatus Paceibacterota bacterium]